MQPVADRITTAICLDLDISRRRFLDCPHPDSSEDKRATHGSQGFDADSPPSFAAGLGAFRASPICGTTNAGPQSILNHTRSRLDSPTPLLTMYNTKRFNQASMFETSSIARERAATAGNPRTQYVLHID